MISPSQTLPNKDGAERVTTLSQRILTVGYFTAVAVAMAGWLFGLRWIILTAVRWMIV